MIKLTFKITTTFMLFLLIFVSCKKDIIDEAQVAQNGYHVVATNKENKLLNLLDNMKLTVANGKQSSMLDDLDLDNALKKTDEQGNVFYSLYVDSEDPLSLVNVSLNEIEGELFGRVLYQRIDEDWLLRQETFPGWGNYTGTFRVTDLEGDILYEVNVDNGSSASEVSTNGRAYCISELTKTQETCIPDLSICYPQYEWITSCEWFWAGGNYIGSGGPAITPPGSSSGGNGSNTIGVGVYNPGFADEDMSDLVAEIEANKVNEWEDKIDDTQLKPCMQTIMNDLTKLTKGVGWIVTTFSGTTYNWKMKDGKLKGSTNAATNPFYDKATSTVTTTFDSREFTEATELSTARTILHESVHAYLVTFFATDPILANSTYSSMVQEWVKKKKPNLNKIQHNEMVRSFKNDIGLSLEEYGKSIGYAYSSQFYQDLAWGGLQKSDVYKKLPTVDKNRIQNIIQIELDGIDTNEQQQTQKGKNAGC